MGPFNLSTYKYDYIYTDDEHGVNWALDNVQKLMDKYGKHPAVYALEPVNEPWWNSDMSVLKDFYRNARNIVRSVNPSVIFAFHDAF